MKIARHIGSALLALLPLVVLAYLSVVMQWTFPQLFDAQFTTRHWHNTLAGGNGLAESFLYSAAVALSMAVLGTYYGFVVARHVVTHKHGRRLLAFAFLPYLIAPVVTGSMLRYFFVRAEMQGTLIGVMVAQALFILPYSVLLFATFWNDRVRRTAFQAVTLGATHTQLTWRVLVPMARPWILLCAVQCFLFSWFEFGITQLIAAGKVPMLTVAVMRALKEADVHLAAVAGCLMVFPLFLLVVLSRRRLTQLIAVHDLDR